MNSRSLLYTWHDVEAVLRSALNDGRLPSHWVGTDASPVALMIQIGASSTPEAEDEAWAGLTALFSARASREKQGILLESIPGQERLLPVMLDYIPGLMRVPRPARPLFQAPPMSSADVPERLLGTTPVVAFYSYKGGVGRTLSLLGLARTLVQRDLEQGGVSRPLLIVDADYEAPGLTWLAQRDGQFKEFSVQDALALVHGAADWKSEVLGLMLDRVKSETLRLPVSGRLTEHFFLPAFRSQAQLLSPPVRPDQLLRGPGRRWIMADMLSILGEQLGASAVLVDCRAGVSELSAPIVLDPRVRRVVVTSTSLQSVEGTSLVLRDLKERLPSTAREVDPSVIITMVPSDPRLRIGEAVRESLIQTYLETDSEEDADQTGPVSEPLTVWELPFSSDLVHLSDLADIDSKLSRSGHEPALKSLAEELLPLRQATQPVPVIQQAPRTALDALATFCYAQEYAENSQTGAFLRTIPLKNLARKFSSEAPRAVVMGAKGAGKTFTFLQLVTDGDWRSFVRSLGFDSGPISSAHPVIPLVRPRHLDQGAIGRINDAWAKANKALGTTSALNPDGVAEKLQRQVSDGLIDEIRWRDFWTETIAEVVGIGVHGNDPLAALQEFLDRTDQYVTFVVDGLEDWLPGAHTEKAQQAAILGLCLGALDKLISLPNRRIGLVVFVRKDLPQTVLKQNFGQFERLHEAYELRWSIDEALRLVLWAVKQAGIDKALSKEGLPEDLTAYVGPELEDRLLPLWGLKLGTDAANEAYSTNWVLSALSDFHGRLQARDLMRFLHHAAQASKATPENQRKVDRLLQIAAVKGAIKPCGEKRIDEIKQEIPALTKILDEIRNAPEGLRRMPFMWDTFSLSSDQVQLLKSQGVVYEEDGKLYTPEIYRQGLGLGLAKGARPKVITLMRRALSQRG